MRIRASVSDVFHRIVDDLVRRSGGPGNLGQLRLHLDGEVDVPALAAAWREAGRRAPVLAATCVDGWRGARFDLRTVPDLVLETSATDIATIAGADLRSGLSKGNLVRLHLGSDGAVLTWHHALCDARGAQGLLRDLGTGLREAWWEPSYRQDRDLPTTAAGRGRDARGAVDLLRPLRSRPILRLARTNGNAAVPLRQVTTCLGAETAAVDGRIRSIVGRFGETAFCLAAVAAALAEHGDGLVVFPLAVDERAPGTTRCLANAHGFLFLSVDADLARRDLAAAARHLRDAHKAWIAAEGNRKLLAALSWLPLAGSRMARFQLGFGRPGLHASACVANTGATILGETWFGAQVRGVDHTIALPGNPGVAVLFHRDARGLGFDTIVTGALSRRLPPEALAARVRFHLCDRVLDA